MIASLKGENERLSVKLLEGKDIGSSKTWEITLKKPAYKVVTGINSNCNLAKDYQETTQSGTKTIKFTVPGKGTIIPDYQICMLEIKMGQDTYHEHFATTDNICYGWAEIKWTPKSP
jgi:hypothetical protein